MTDVNLNAVNIEAIDAMHDLSLAMDGGLAGYKDKGALASAVHRALTRQYYDKKADLFDLISATGYALIKNHPYNDGNKRTGALFTLTVLKENGYEINLSDKVLHNFFQSIAAGDIDEKGMSDFLRKSAIKTQVKDMLLQKVALKKER